MSALVAVRLGEPSLARAQHVVRSAYAFDATLERLKQAIADAGLWLIHEINPQMLLEKEGYRIPAARQLLFFHPRYMMRLLANDPAALPEVPLKFVVMQTPEGVVTVRNPDPAALLERYNDMEELSRELSALCTGMLRAVEA